MRNSRLSASSPSEEIQINLTPLIDVVFVVLITFILVAPMLDLDRVELASAGAHADKTSGLSTDIATITIHVHADNSIWINQTSVSHATLLPLLTALKARKPQAIPQLFHDKSAHFGTYQQIKNALEKAGFEQLDVILQGDS